MATRALTVATFGGASAEPVRVGVERGLFARLDLEVTSRLTPGSPTMCDWLLSGSCQIVHAAPDNAIAWADATGAPVVAWLGGSGGPISLVAGPDGAVAAVADLRGRRIGVDARASGFAPILRRLLAGAGLTDRDVELVEVGATRLRFEALRDGRIEASLLTEPWSLLAADLGAVVLADHRAVAPDLQTSAGIALRPWLAAEAAVADAYRAALRQATAWLRDPLNRDEAAAGLAASMGVAGPVGLRVLETMRDPVLGWPPDAALRPGGMAAVHRLRSEGGVAIAGPIDAYVAEPPSGPDA